MNDVSLIIPVYIVDNELKKMTDKCIESAYKTAPGVEIIVVVLLPSPRILYLYIYIYIYGDCMR
jgi:hypothetical protein